MYPVRRSRFTWMFLMSPYSENLSMMSSSCASSWIPLTNTIHPSMAERERARGRGREGGRERGREGGTKGGRDRVTKASSRVLRLATHISWGLPCPHYECCQNVPSAQEVYLLWIKCETFTGLRYISHLQSLFLSSSWLLVLSRLCDL